MPTLVNWDLLSQPYNWVIVTLTLAIIVGVLMLLTPSIQQVGYGPLNPLLDR